eukprot:2958771-Rhodomonas_salina.1
MENAASCIGFRGVEWPHLAASAWHRSRLPYAESLCPSPPPLPHSWKPRSLLHACRCRAGVGRLMVSRGDWQRCGRRGRTGSQRSSSSRASSSRAAHGQSALRAALIPRLRNQTGIQHHLAQNTTLLILSWFASSTRRPRQPSAEACFVSRALRLACHVSERGMRVSRDQGACLRTPRPRHLLCCH